VGSGMDVGLERSEPPSMAVRSNAQTHSSMKDGCVQRPVP
jgi:hypothetical protein